MEYQYSRLVDPSGYVTEGLCEGMPLRVHKYPELEDIGALRAQQDWNEHVAPVQNYRGGLGPQYSFMAVAIPECLPDRLELISYANEFAFLHDGSVALPSDLSYSYLLQTSQILSVSCKYDTRQIWLGWSLTPR